MSQIPERPPNPGIVWKSARAPFIVVVTFAIALTIVAGLGIQHSWRERDETRRYCDARFDVYSTEWENCIEYGPPPR